MEVLHPRCAGLDVHRDGVVACARLVQRGAIERHVEAFGTTTSELERLSRWLAGHAVTHVAMEATGVYWKPVWAVLAERFELVLANAMHVRNVPGRKTDVNDATWLADLLAHGLIRASFVPPQAIQALRELTRTRSEEARGDVHERPARDHDKVGAHARDAGRDALAQRPAGDEAGEADAHAEHHRQAEGHRAQSASSDVLRRDPDQQPAVPPVPRHLIAGMLRGQLQKPRFRS
jgi:hypothetical protein